MRHCTSSYFVKGIIIFQKATKFKLDYEHSFSPTSVESVPSVCLIVGDQLDKSLENFKESWDGLWHSHYVVLNGVTFDPK